MILVAAFSIDIYPTTGTNTHHPQLRQPATVFSPALLSSQHRHPTYTAQQRGLTTISKHILVALPRLVTSLPLPTLTLFANPSTI